MKLTTLCLIGLLITTAALVSCKTAKPEANMRVVELSNTVPDGTTAIKPKYQIIRMTAADAGANGATEVGKDYPYKVKFQYGPTADGEATQSTHKQVFFEAGGVVPMPIPGWFAQLPEPMQENLLEWMFYLMTHKPPMEGMPPASGAVNPQAAGAPNEMMERVKGAIAERDQKIERLTCALEEAKAQGGNPGEMEQRFKSKLEEMEKRIQGREQEFTAAMEKAEARVKELNSALEESRKNNAEKENIIAKQKERIGEMEKAIQELKAKVEKLQGKPEPNG